jgi:hypothetical protein
MCHYITLVAASSDASMLDAVMRTHGRRATPIDNPSLGAILRPGEHQYLTAARHCDCGTVFANGTELSAEEAAEERRRQWAKLEKKGWSTAKIERWFEDTERAEARPRSSAADSDSIELWTAVLNDLVRERGVAAGLFVHAYRGGLDTETFEARRNDVRPGLDLGARLSNLTEDQLLMVSPK